MGSRQRPDGTHVEDLVGAPGCSNNSPPATRTPHNLRTGNSPDSSPGGSGPPSRFNSGVVTSGPLRLGPCLYGSHMANLKGEDGLRVERLLIGGDTITAALVVDGHGGHFAAELVCESALEAIAQNARGDASGDSLQFAVRTTFRELHARMNHADFGSTSGTTCTVCLVNESRGELTVCSVGDSFAVLVSPPVTDDAATLKKGPDNSWKTDLTCNMRLDDNEEERERVKAAGGQIGKAMSPEGIPCGPLRAWPGGIQCASSLGDADCGEFVSPEPYCVHMPFPDTAALIVCSDGVWDALTFITAAKVVLSASDPAVAAEKLVAKAVRARGLRDDTTAVVLVGGVSMQSLTSSEPSSDASNEFAASEIQNAASSTPRGRDSPPPSRFHVRSGIKSLLRAPVKLRDHIGSENSVKGGKLFEALAKSLSSSGGMDMLNNNNSNSNDSKHSEHSFSSGHSSESNSDSVNGVLGTISRMVLGSESPDPSVDGSEGGIPLFAFLHGAPRLRISPSGSREQLSGMERRGNGSPRGSPDSSPVVGRRGTPSGSPLGARSGSVGNVLETPPRAGPPRTSITVPL